MWKISIDYKSVVWALVGYCVIKYEEECNVRTLVIMY